MTPLAGLLLFTALLQNTPAVDPDALVWFRKGEELIGTPEENSPQQTEYFEKAVELAPDFSAARYNLALVYLKQEQRQLALDQLDALIALEPNGTSGYLLRARVRLEEEEPGRAAEDLEQALELDPQNYDTWQLMGRIRYQQRDYEQAARAFEKVLELRPNPVGAYFDLALSQQSLGQRDEAIKNYRRFLIDVPDDFQANYFLGILYRQAGQDDLALEQFLKAESIEPTHQELAQELGYLLLDRNDLEGAQERDYCVQTWIWPSTWPTWESSPNGGESTSGQRTTFAEPFSESRITLCSGPNWVMSWPKQRVDWKPLRLTKGLSTTIPKTWTPSTIWGLSMSMRSALKKRWIY